MIDVIVGVLSVSGALLFVASAVGLIRLPDFYTRLHAPTKAATLGILLLAGASILRGGDNGSTWILDALLVAFLMLTMPVSAQMLAKAALRRGEAQAPRTRGEPPA